MLMPLAGPAAAGDSVSDEAEFFSLEKSSLEEVLNIRTSVATRSTLPLREAPGLVTVITREEIQASGARDLLDVLKMVPEFEFGVDVQGNLGLGVRGNWANEGKVLLLWDAQPYNELLYSTIQFDRFPVDQIQKVEIIKGPGSVVYGGFAELAVIKIETRSPQELNGSKAYAAYGQGDRARARSYAGYSFGRRLGGTDVSAKAFWGDAQRGDGVYRDLSGASYSLNRNSDLRPKNLNLYAARGGASTRLIVDDYSLRERDHFGSVLTTGSARVDFRSVFYEAKYDWDLSDEVRIEPRLNYAGARPWRENDEHFPYDKETARLTASLYSFYRPGGAFDGMLGAEYYNDTIKTGSGTGAASAAGSAPRRRYDNASLFGQASVEAGPASVAAGLRYENNSHYGSSLVPRLSATGVRGDFNFKAIYSQAFRAPSAENIRLNPDIDPERTTSAELEAGYKASDSLFVSANVFHVSIRHPIVFTVTGGGETYANFSRSGTKGFGFSSKYKLGGVRADLGYLFQNTDCNTVGLYAVPGHGSYMLAFPRHKLTASASLPLADGVSLNPSAVYTSVRYGYSSAGTVKAYPALTLLDANLQLRDKLLRGLTLNAGLKDIFNSGHSYLQPYNGGHAPLPGWGREIFVKAAYEF
jgi:outer membrane cobalamin receptor